MAVRILLIDAFTDRPFTGNPAAVCILPGARSERWMQAVAQEMNLSETAFLVPRADGYDLRWFTPAVEVDLCGHATLASAHALWEVGELKPDEPARFHTQSGVLTATRAGDWIELDFPADPETPAEPPPGLVEALRAKPLYVGLGRESYLLELESEAAVRTLAPHFGLLAAATDRCVIVTAADRSGRYDFVSRFFGLPLGIEEDPVTGAAHCCLACFWHRRLQKREFLAHQASARGGTLRVRYREDRVGLAGQAVTVADGLLRPEDD